MTEPIPPAAQDRDVDLVLVGATGFTGRLAAKHLARHRPDGLRWALAGRSTARLADLRAELEAVDPALADLPLVEVDGTDQAAVDALVARTRVLVNASGPYLLHGEPWVRACAEQGTDYVDLSGEPEFVDAMHLRHDATARRTGARLVHACGFDSVPHDLGALVAAQALAADGPVEMYGVVSAGGGVSGGTLHSALGALSRLRPMRRTAQQRAAADPRSGAKGSVTGRPRKDPVTGRWLLPTPAIDQQLIARSGARRADYGPAFRYSHYSGVKRLPVLVGAAAGITVLLGVAQVPPLRRLITAKVPQGSGPDDKTRAAASFIVDVVGRSGDRRVHVRVTGPDPYDISGVALAESALSLAFDDNPDVAGQCTTAEAMGESLIQRLEQHGVTFEVLDKSH